MKESFRQRKVDDLVNHFWRNGYLTLSRKYGKYLPEPNNIGNYEVDAIGKLKKKFAIGVTLSEEELNDPKIYSKLEFLATRHTKFSNSRVTLFVGVPKELFNKVKICLTNLTTEAQKNIKVVAISDENRSKNP
ncbi:MAG: hypothetical protein WAR79_04680 [Melioribacteraceae bacterium]